MINPEGKNEYRQYDILPNLTIYDLKANLSRIYNIPQNQMELLLNNNPLQDKQVVKNIGIGNNLIVLRRKSNQTNFSQNQALYSPQGQNIINTPMGQSLQASHIQNYSNTPIGHTQQGYQNPYTTNIPQGYEIPYSTNSPYDQPLQDPQLQNLINTPIDQSIQGTQRQNLNNSLGINPELLGLSSSALNDVLENNNLLNSNMDTPEAQRKILEIIQNQRINDNFRQATEFMPESLIPVHMLFISIEINNQKVYALVDTGAQSSFMSDDLCRKCNLMSMVDKRFQGVARGVGASRILGVIHSAQIKIMNKTIMVRINIIENNDVGFVLGLDNLRKYNCNVDLKKNGLVFPDFGITAKFLSDGEIKNLKLEKNFNQNIGQNFEQNYGQNYDQNFDQNLEQNLEEEEREEIERAKLESLNYL